MTPLARAAGLTVSVTAHVVAGVLLLTLSAPEWTRPLFVDLVERAESIGGGAGRTGGVSGQASPRREEPAPRATRGPWQRSRRGSESDAAAPVQTPPALASPPDSSPSPPDPSPNPPDPSPNRKVAPTTEPPPPTATDPATPSPPLRTATAPPSTRDPAETEAAASRSDLASPPTAEPWRSPTAGGGARGEARGGDGRGRGEARSDAGSALGETPGSPLALGTGGGGIPPAYGPYLQRFRRHVQESLVYPLAARRQGLRGTVELDVSLDPSGRVRDVRVARSSSYGILDDAAVDALRRLDPLPLPESLPRRSLVIRLPLVFDLR